MTESEWNDCADPAPMLECLRGKVSDRKLRLFAVACCRRIWHLLADEESRHAVQVADRLAEGLATNEERRAAALARPTGSGFWSFGAAGCAVGVPAFHAAERGSGNAQLLAADGVPSHIQAGQNPAWQKVVTEEAGRQAVLLRDIFRNPFRTPAVMSSFPTPAVVALAHAAYDNRTLPTGKLDPIRLAVLAEALEGSGCDNQEILTHCRLPGEHVRGCWVVDLVLGKE